MNALAVAEPGIVDEETGLERLSDWSDGEWEYQKKKARETAATQAALDAEPSRAAVDEALADLPDSAPDDLPPEEIIVAGLEMSFFSAGGKKPTTASLAFTGGKVKLREGTALKKGQRIVGRFEAVVNFVGQQDETDGATGQVTACEQQHKARFVDLALGMPTDAT
jgi:hypothetical protein